MTPADTGPLLTTPRLELWRPRAGDLDSLVDLLAGDEMTRFLGPVRAERQPQFDRLLRNGGSWAMFGYGLCYLRRPGDSQIVGSCGVFPSYRGFGKGMDDVPEAGWIVRQDCWGQGFAAEAMGAILEWFDATHGAQRMTCMIEHGNAISERLAHKLGFAQYGSHVEGDDDRVVLALYERLPPRA